MFWPGVLLAEHKSAGADLIRAWDQALAYLPGLKSAELPRHVLVCDFQTFELTDLESNDTEPLRFALADLPRHVEAFGFIMGGERRTFRDQDPANVLASELMAKVHDGLQDGGYEGSDLERYLVRLLFCLFADDTGIFDRGAFQLLLEQRTREDGSDLGLWLNELWTVLDTHLDRRNRSLDEELAAFPYINGELFKQRLPTAHFTADSRKDLLEACGFAWETISPAIFGSLFQGVMDTKARRKKGAHYTTEKNILKVIQPLFLDELCDELERLKARRDTRRNEALNSFIEKLGRLRFLDPACGCGNFLVITCRELRRLETEALVARYRPDRMAEQSDRFDVGALTRVRVEQFHGIELEEFPARIAEVALWMTDHIENVRLGLDFGQPYARIPLVDAPHIVQGDALEANWAEVLAPERCDYVVGNPPFIGAKYQSETQRAQVRRIAGLGGSGGTLDYVAAWFIKAGDYAATAARSTLEPLPGIGDTEVGRWTRAVTGELLVPDLDQGSMEAVAKSKASESKEAPAPRISFVSTNSITQGEQVAQLWPILFRRHKLEITFAHRTFAWKSEARGSAHVHVVIIGLARRGQEPSEKRLFSYDHINSDPVESKHPALTAYLFEPAAPSLRHEVVVGRALPLSPNIVAMANGNVAADGGHLVFDSVRRDAILRDEPGLADLMKPFIGAEDLLHGTMRYCFWLVDCPHERLRNSKILRETVVAVRQMRLASAKVATQERADTATLFTERRQPASGDYLAVPRTSSERRDYVPLGYLDHTTIAANDLQIVPGATTYDFGVLHSAMHNAWTRVTSGRLESRIRYSAKFTYNTFPWPRAEGVKRGRVERAAQAVLDARAAHEGATLADLYDPDLMPPNLRKAHRELDEAVDRLYRATPFGADRERAEHLFGLYEKMTAGLLAGTVKPKRRRKAVN